MATCRGDQSARVTKKKLKDVQHVYSAQTQQKDINKMASPISPPRRERARFSSISHVPPFSIELAACPYVSCSGPSHASIQVLHVRLSILCTETRTTPARTCENQCQRKPFDWPDRGHVVTLERATLQKAIRPCDLRARSFFTTRAPPRSAEKQQDGMYWHHFGLTSPTNTTS